MCMPSAWHSVVCCKCEHHWITLACTLERHALSHTQPPNERQHVEVSIAVPELLMHSAGAKNKGAVPAAGGHSRCAASPEG